MKTTTLSIEEWQKIVNQYQIFDGTIDQFCQQKHITRSQLYYYKKNLKIKILILQNFVKSH